MHKKLEEIITKTKADVRKYKQSSKVFFKALKNPKQGSVAIIAEIKLTSPTEKLLGKAADIQKRAREYELAEVDCISVVTEKHFFHGDPKFVKAIKDVVSLPVLQKDFIIDPYQVYEAKQMGADAILLIVRILSEKDLITLVNLAKEIGIESVVEINSEEDLQKAQTSGTKIIAVNARDLDTFAVDVNKTCQLLKKIPEKFIKLGFSGIHSRAEVEKYRQAGAKAVLVGTALMKTNNVNKLIKELKNVS